MIGKVRNRCYIILGMWGGKGRGFLCWCDYKLIIKLYKLFEMI